MFFVFLGKYIFENFFNFSTLTKSNIVCIILNMKNFKAIIKNCCNFGNDIKLASGLMLNMNDKIKRQGYKGYSTQEFGSYWFSSPKGFVIFKNTNENMKSVGDIQLLNEILCFRLAKQMGIDVAEYVPAQINNVKGIASVNFVGEGEKLMSASEVVGSCGRNIKSIIQALMSEKIKYDVDLSQIFYGLYKMTIFDLLTFQSDRHLNNVSFILDQKNILRLAPMYDNEYSFFVTSYVFRHFDSDFNTVKEYVDNYYIGTGVIAVEPVFDVERLNCYDTYLKQVVEVAKVDSDCNRILKNLLNKADLSSIYSDLKKEGYIINKDYEKFTCSLIDFAKNRIKSFYGEKLKNDLQR